MASAGRSGDKPWDGSTCWLPSSSEPCCTSSLDLGTPLSAGKPRRAPCACTLLPQSRYFSPRLGSVAASWRPHHLRQLLRRLAGRQARQARPEQLRGLPGVPARQGAKERSSCAVVRQATCRHPPLQPGERCGMDMTHLQLRNCRGSRVRGGPKCGEAGRRRAGQNWSCHWQRLRRFPAAAAPRAPCSNWAKVSELSADWGWTDDLAAVWGKVAL